MFLAAEHFSYSIRGQSQVAQNPGGMINPGQRLFGHPLVGNLADQSLTEADQKPVYVDGFLQHILSPMSTWVKVWRAAIDSNYQVSV